MTQRFSAGDAALATPQETEGPWRDGALGSDGENGKTDALAHRTLIDEQVAEMNALQHVIDLALQQHPHRSNAAALRFGTSRRRCATLPSSSSTRDSGRSVMR